MHEVISEQDHRSIESGLIRLHSTAYALRNERYALLRNLNIGAPTLHSFAHFRTSAGNGV